MSFAGQSNPGDSIPSKIDWMTSDKIVVLSTAASPEEAERIARHLLELRLAACVNLLPGVRSIYRWKGAVEESLEIMMVIKSSRDLFELLEAAIKSVHSYQVPEVIALPIVVGSEAYMNWLQAELEVKI